MHTPTKTWLAQIAAVVLVLPAAGTAPASSPFLSGDSPPGCFARSENGDRASVQLSGEPQGGCGRCCRYDAAGVSVEPVFNLEVEGDHCYRVGEQGLLVHNNSVPTAGQPAQQPCGCEEVVASLRQGGMVSATVLRSMFQMTPQDLWAIACQLHDQITMARRGDANENTRQHADDHTVAIALVCITSGDMKGQFQLWGTNSFRDQHTVGVTFRNGVWLVPTTQIPPWVPRTVRHAERRLLRAARGVAMLVGVAASREVCPTCEDRLQGVEFLTPLASAAGGTAFDAAVTCMGQQPFTPR